MANKENKETEQTEQTEPKKKSNAGRKPLPTDEKKATVNLFIPEYEINKRGGKKALQNLCYEFLGLSII